MALTEKQQNWAVAGVLVLSAVAMFWVYKRKPNTDVAKADGKKTGTPNTLKSLVADLNKDIANLKAIKVDDKEWLNMSPEKMKEQYKFYSDKKALLKPKVDEINGYDANDMTSEMVDGKKALNEVEKLLETKLENLNSMAQARNISLA